VGEQVKSTAEIVLNSAEIILNSAEIILNSAEIILNSAEFVLNTPEIILNSAVFFAVLAAEGLRSGGKWSSAGENRTPAPAQGPGAGGVF
jgi:hypothetical protein